MTCTLTYSSRLGTGQARAELTDESLDIVPAAANAWSVSWRQVAAVEAADYRIRLQLDGGQDLQLSGIGYQYEDFLRELVRRRNEVILDDLLMGEKLVRGAFRAEFKRRDGSGRVLTAGACELRLYETGLVALPDSGDLWRLPAGRIAAVQPAGYELTVRRDDGQELVVARMGAQTDPFRRELTAWLGELDLVTQQRLRDRLPDLPAAAVPALAVALRDGRGAGRDELDAVHAGAWPALLEQLCSGPLADDLALLLPQGDAGQMVIGCKRSLFHEGSGDYAWVLLPLRGGLIAWLAADDGGATAAAAGPEAVPVEAAGPDVPDSSAAGDDRASYFFRGEAAASAARCRELARGLVEINFRREPIYLSDRALNEARYIRYRTAARRIPELAGLRRLFAGRVAHRGAADWRQGVQALLARAAATEPGR